MYACPGSAAIKLHIQSSLIGHYEYDAWYWRVVVMASSLAFTASFVFAEVGRGLNDSRCALCGNADLFYCAAPYRGVRSFNYLLGSELLCCIHWAPKLRDRLSKILPTTTTLFVISVRRFGYLWDSSILRIGFLIQCCQQSLWS